MKEIISIQVGQCGNQVAAKFWQTVCEQHCILPSGEYYGGSDLQLQMIETYFNQSTDGKYIPRAVLMDLDQSLLNKIKTESPFGQIFRPDNFINAERVYGAGNNWAKGHYTDGAEMIDDGLDIIRREAEGCDCLQGFQITHGLGGGTGSGFGTLLISKLKEEYTSNIIETSTIFTINKTDNIVDPYNNTLSIPHLIENADNCIVFDNEALYDISFRSLKLTTPSHGDLNRIIAPAMSTITSRLRLPGQIHPSLRELAYDLVPLPRLHFLIVGLAPLISRKFKKKRQLEVAELTSQIFQARNTLCEASPPHGRYLAASAIYRGKISSSQVEREIANKQTRQPLQFVQHMANKINFSVCETPINEYKTAAVSISNSTSIERMFKRISDQFACMFRRKAFLHWFIGEGMDQMEFTEAQIYSQNMQQQYIQNEDRMVDTVSK